MRRLGRLIEDTLDLLHWHLPGKSWGHRLAHVVGWILILVLLLSVADIFTDGAIFRGGAWNGLRDCWGSLGQWEC